MFYYGLNLCKILVKLFGGIYLTGSLCLIPSSEMKFGLIFANNLKFSF